MIRTFPFATLAAAAFALPAFAGEATLDTALETDSLHDGSVDLVAYYMPVEDGALELTATFAAKDGGAPARFVMAMAEGDAVQFALPGHRDTIYSFARAGARVTLTAAPVETAKIEAKL